MTFLFAAALLAAPGAVVIQPVANLYSAPSQGSDVVSQAILGTNIGVIEEKEGWARVRTPDDYSGWMPQASFLKLGEGDRPYGSHGAVAHVESLFANLYAEPDVTRHAPVATVPFETRLEVASQPEGEDSRWLEVRLPNGHRAWIQRGDVRSSQESLTIDAVTALAKRFLGLPYLWGGTSSFGYDCSGYTQMLYRRRGLLLPRDASPQAYWEGFKVVARAEVQPGDLVFFGESGDKITHTGMYIGDGEFIHATAYKRPVVQVSRLDDPHWSPRLVACRRTK